jgi:hypothetical protein
MGAPRYFVKRRRKRKKRQNPQPRLHDTIKLHSLPMRTS